MIQLSSGNGMTPHPKSQLAWLGLQATKPPHSIQTTHPNRRVFVVATADYQLEVDLIL